MFKKMIGLYSCYFDLLNPILRDIFLLLIRFSWGYGFFQAGKGKFINFDRTSNFFSSLGIPFPEINVFMAASTELFGGLLLVLGLGARLVPLPLIFTMLVAYITAHREELFSVLSEKSTFTEAEPFLYLISAVIIFLFGAGRFSLDYIILRVKIK